MALPRNVPLPQAAEAIEQPQQGGASGAIDSGGSLGPRPTAWTVNRMVQPWLLGENDLALALRSSKMGRIPAALTKPPPQRLSYCKRTQSREVIYQSKIPLAPSAQVFSPFGKDFIFPLAESSMDKITA